MDYRMALCYTMSYDIENIGEVSAKKRKEESKCWIDVTLFFVY